MLYKATLFLLIFFWQNLIFANPNQYAIATAHPLATKAGEQILKQGGNAFDAAVAISAALAVVEPAGSGLGGGGFWLLHRQSDNLDIMVDGRERAPFAAHRNMYLDDKGNVIKALSKTGALSAGIPGLPAALSHIAEKYGRLPLSTSLKPAINIARRGFSIGKRHLRMLAFRHKVLNQSTAASQIFLDDGKKFRNQNQFLFRLIWPTLYKQLPSMEKKASMMAKLLNCWFKQFKMRGESGADKTWKHIRLKSARQLSVDIKTLKSPAPPLLPRVESFFLKH
jgi:hypothetical protein